MQLISHLNQKMVSLPGLSLSLSELKLTVLPSVLRNIITCR